MTDPAGKQVACPSCGQIRSSTRAVCPACGDVNGSGETVRDASLEWVRERGSLKTKWVISVMAFWVSASVLAVIYFLKGGLDMILMSISLGMLIIGVYLKARYQAHLRKEPPRH